MAAPVDEETTMDEGTADTSADTGGENAEQMFACPNCGQKLCAQKWGEENGEPAGPEARATSAVRDQLKKISARPEGY